MVIHLTVLDISQFQRPGNGSLTQHWFTFAWHNRKKLKCWYNNVISASTCELFFQYHFVHCYRKYMLLMREENTFWLNCLFIQQLYFTVTRKELTYPSIPLKY